MIEREFRVLRALEGTGFPAPRALALCEDESVIGTAFYVMAHVDGRIFWDPALPDLEREERAPIYDAMNAALAETPRDRRQRGRPFRLRQARQLFRPPAAALERAISGERDGPASRTWSG